MHKLYKNLLTISGIICLILALTPIISYGVGGVGAVVIIAAGAVLLIYGNFSHLVNNKIRKMINLSIIIAAVVLAVITIIMLKAAYFNKPSRENPPGAVVILGCQIQGSQPSLMLNRRLKSAVEYLNENKTAVVIVSGGMGKDEKFSESYVMKQYLISHGIEEGNIIEEDSSLNTQQNIAYTAEIIKQQKLDINIVIITDAFHQLRAAKYAKNYGLIPYSKNAITPLPLIPVYYVREYLAIIKAIIFGNLL